MASPSSFENKDLRAPGFCRKVYPEMWPMLYVCHVSQQIADVVPLIPKLPCLFPKKRDLVLYNHRTMIKIRKLNMDTMSSINSEAQFQSVSLLQRHALPRNMSLELSRLFCPFWTRTVAQSFFIFTWSFSFFNLDIFWRVQAIYFVDGYLIWVCLMFPRDWIWVMNFWQKHPRSNVVSSLVYPAGGIRCWAGDIIFD